MGTGSGQVALELSRLFDRVVATDPSARQIENSATHARVEYRVEAAERASLESASVDLVTVAQALHWFDFPRFYAEVRRVLKPGGLLAVWCYGLVRVGGGAGLVLDDFHDVVEPYWPPERRYVREEYRAIPFPFAEIQAPRFCMEAEWDAARLLGYLGTWSAVARCREATGDDPIAALRPHLETAWGSPGNRKPLQWPVHLRVGRQEPVSAGFARREGG